MQRKTDLRLVGLGLLLAVALLAPGPGLAKENPGSDYGIQKAKVAQDLGLTPDKAKAFLAVGEKYHGSRQAIIERIKKNESALAQALAAAKPDAAKIKGLVAAIISDHNELLDTFRVQRREEMAHLTPVQQGKFLLALKKWHEKLCQKYEKKETKK
jgi:Spy/CpxP family protein refolding chaperone